MDPDAPPARAYVHVFDAKRRREFGAIIASAGLGRESGLLWTPWRFGDATEDPVVVVRLGESIDTGLSRAREAIVALWTHWPDGVGGELVLGDAAGTPLFAINRSHGDLREPLRWLPISALTSGNRFFTWTGSEWHSGPVVAPWRVRPPRPPDADGGLGSGDRSPIIGDGPPGSVGGMVDVPDEAE